MNKSQFIAKLESTLGKPDGMLKWIDKRTKGYRIKLGFFTASTKQIEAVLKLPHVVKAKNYLSGGSHGSYDCFCVFVDCRPKDIKL